MIIEQIILENFRSYYGTQSLRLDKGLSKGRNIVAIGGLNGAGKTSFMDAITFGLLGQNDAFAFVKKKIRKGNEKNSIVRELNGLLNREAFSEGSREAAVTLFVSGDDGKRFALKRTWQFDSRGLFKNEELIVTTAKGEPLTAGAASIEELNERIKDFVKGHLPPQVAGFFFFDGEEIQRIASDDPQEGVREGVEQLLGFHLLDALSGDMTELLEKYRSESRKRNKQELDLDALRVEEKRLQNEQNEAEEEKQDYEARVDELKERSRKLVEELRAVVGGSGRDPREVQDELEEVNRSIQDAKRDLEATIEQRIMPGLAGALARKLAEQLDAEDRRTTWEEGKLRVEPKRELLISRIFGPEAPSPIPRLAEAQVVFLTQRVRGEWDQLFNPPPAGIAQTLRHRQLSEEERKQARAKCVEVLRSGSPDLSRALASLDGLHRRASDLRAQIEGMGDSELAAKLVAEKGKIDRELGEVVAKWEEKKRLLESIANQLRELKKQVRQREDELRETGESATKEDFARRVKRVLEDYKEALRPRKRDEVADYLGKMYKLLARKEDVVDRIELDEKTFAPRLLDRRGKQLSLDSQSAGEREIYALSLLWALGKASQRAVPVVIDTPLARLDSAHRENIVKRYLPQAGHQVIVLSTDTEIDRKYLDMIDAHIATAFRLEFDPVTERTTLNEGYFRF
ncbi:MAG TPA: DNA sulfur modification protein DndD [Phycisphaerales bacterium]|nr:DNA sulfur modification protein DndD [Phycisphaerales bacterium]